MTYLVNDTLKEYIDLVKKCTVSIIVGNHNNEYTDDWFSINYNGYQDRHTYRVKLLSLKVILTQAIRKRLTYFIDRQFNGEHYSIIKDEGQNLFPQKSVEQSYITKELENLKALFYFTGGKYTHKNTTVKINEEQTADSKNYDDAISEFIEVAYGSLMELLAVEVSYAKFRSFFLGSDRQKDTNLDIVNNILENVGAVDCYGQCLLNNTDGKNNRAILWAIKDVLTDRGIFQRAIKDRNFIQMLWKYIDGQKPVPERRHPINDSTKEENESVIKQLYHKIISVKASE